MKRSHYMLFSEASIAGMALPNRLVRSATWDPCILAERTMTDDVVDRYGEVARGGAGLIISGGFPVTPEGVLDAPDPQLDTTSYADAEIEGVAGIVEAVHRARPECMIVAQLEDAVGGAGPSAIASPFSREEIRPLSVPEIRWVVECFVQAAAAMKRHGFDGVQLHAAHGALLSRFLSPYHNRRDDQYGGSVVNRARIVAEIVAEARKAVGDFPILVKINCTDYVEGGTDKDTFPTLAGEMERVGIDAIEISGGMWDCLIRSEEELGFRPVPAPESHTRINDPGVQSYFLEYAEQLNARIPVILVGGNRDVERLEEIVRQGKVDFIALCRPLISEPDLPRRWLEGRGSSSTDCVSCNSCLYDMFVHPGRPEPGLVRCVFKQDKQMHRTAQEWLAKWVERNRLT